MKVASVQTKINLGIFVIVVALLIGLSIIIASDHIRLFNRSRSFEAHFDNTIGLVAGAPVRMGGVEVGQVTQITITPKDQGFTISSKLSIDSPYFDLISKNASVSLDTLGLLGDKFVALNPGKGSGDPPLAENALIPTIDLQGFNSLVKTSADIMDHANNSVKKIDGFTAGLPNTNEVRDMSDDFKASARSLHQLITSLTSKDSFFAVLNDAHSKALLNKTLVSLESAASHTDSIVKKLDSGQGTLGALINDKSVYEDLRALLGHHDRGKIARRIFIEAASKSETK